MDAESHFGLKFTLNPRRRSSVASANASIKSSGPSQESADTSWLRPARRICPSFGGPRVRIHFPRLARDFSFLYRKAGSCRSVWPRPGGMVGRDAQGTSTSRQLLEISLSGSIPVPQCRLGALQPGCTGAPREIGLAMRPSFEFGPAQGKPSTVRCSCQPSGRRECASSLFAVRSGG